MNHKQFAAQMTALNALVTLGAYRPMSRSEGSYSILSRRCSVKWTENGYEYGVGLHTEKEGMIGWTVSAVAPGATKTEEHCEAKAGWNLTDQQPTEIALALENALGIVDMRMTKADL